MNNISFSVIDLFDLLNIYKCSGCFAVHGLIRVAWEKLNECLSSNLWEKSAF